MFNRQSTTRRKILQTTAVGGTIGLAGCADLLGGPDAFDYEVWGFDQGTDTLYVYEPNDEEFDLTDTIDVNAFEDVPDEGVVPHMVDFTEDYSYAAVACTGGERVLVFETESRDLVGNIETGPGSHFAGFSPDEEYINVDVIGESRIARIDIDLEEETFEEVNEIVIDENVTEFEETAGLDQLDHAQAIRDIGAPICHQYAPDGRSLHTLGPSYFDSGLVIVDNSEFTVDRFIPGERLPTNCGTIPHPSGEKFYLTAGLPSNPDVEPDADPNFDQLSPEEAREELSAEGVGTYYVYNTEQDEVTTSGSTSGIDAHGFWFTPDEDELWVLNRETNDWIIIDPDIDEAVEDVDAFGPDTADAPDGDAPDIMWSSPDGEYMFTTLRGPNPLSGDPHAATGENPGISVLDIESREILQTLLPDEENEDSDFHAVGVRVTETDSETNTSPPY